MESTNEEEFLETEKLCDAEENDGSGIFSGTEISFATLLRVAFLKELSPSSDEQSLSSGSGIYSSALSSD